MNLGNINFAKLARYTASTVHPFKCLLCSYESNSPAAVRMHFTKAHGAGKGKGRHRSEKPRGTLSLGAEPGLASLHITRPASTNGNGTHHKIGRVRWDAAERELLHEQIIELWQKNPENGITAAVVTAAMHKILKPERWRTFGARSAIAEVFERAEKFAREIVGRGFHPPAPKDVEVPVEVKVNVAQVLRGAPLPLLAGILAEREMEARLAGYEARALPQPSESAQIAGEGGAVKDVTPLLPRVQVVGFRGHQHTDLLAKFADKPVVILKSIDPSAPPDAKLLFPDATILVENQTASGPWRDLVIGNTTIDRRESLYGPNRVIDHIRTMAKVWATKNPVIYKAWVRQRAALAK